MRCKFVKVFLAATCCVVSLAGHSWAYETFEDAKRAANDKANNGDPAGARAILTEAKDLAVTPSEQLAYQQGMGYSYYREKDPVNAEKYFLEALNIRGTSTRERASVWMQLGISRSNNHQPVKAREAYDSLLSLRDLPGGLRSIALVHKAGTYIVEKDPLTAASLMHAAAKEPGNSLSSQAIQYMMAGKHYMTGGQPENAIKEFSLSIEVPEAQVGVLGSAYNGLGDAYLALKKYAEAREAYTSTTTLAGVPEYTKKQALAGLKKVDFAENH